MPLNNPAIGEGYAPAYSISATPFVTSSVVTLGSVREITFPQISRFVTVKNVGADTSVIAVAFTANGLLAANSNYFVLSGSESFSGELRTSKLFISGSNGTSIPFTLVAGLTYINAREMTTITGSNGFSGVG